MHNPFRCNGPHLSEDVTGNVEYLTNKDFHYASDYGSQF